MTNKQTILIAGATGNIGRAAAFALAKLGARVVLLGRRPDKLKIKAESIRAELLKAHADCQDTDIETLVIDFSDMESVRHTAAEAQNRFARINGLVLSVGTLVQNGPNILPNGHELMFATNVLGPFLFTELLLERLQESDGLVLHVIAPFSKDIDWENLESIRNHKPMTAFNRTKTYNRIIAGEMARRYVGKISSVAFDPAFVIDKSDPELAERWPSGFMGFFWRMLTLFFAKPPSIAGGPLAKLMLLHPDRKTLNGALFKLEKRINKPDKAMNNKVIGKRLWDELARMTEQAHKKTSATV